MSREAVALVVGEAIRAVLPGVAAQDIAGHRHLRDLGADSVDRIEIILAIIGRLGLDVPMSSFSDLPDIDALVEDLCRRQPP